MHKDYRKIYIAAVILFIVFTIGVFGFWAIEDHNLVESIYMTVITMSTVGYGTLHDLSHAGMLFASGLIIISIGIFAYFISTITAIFVDGDYKKHLQTLYILKKVKKLENHVVVCGFGRNGRQAIIDLLAHNEQVVLIERSDEVMAEDINERFLKEQNIMYINGDAAHEETLIKANLKKAKALVTSLPNDAENLLIILTVKDFNPNLKIISRASSDNSYSKLKRAGAAHVIMPDKVGGTRMAKLVSQPDIIEFMEMIMIREGVDVNLEEISCDSIASCFYDSSIAELDIRRKTGANLVGIKLGNGGYLFNPAPEIHLQPNDKLFVIGTPEQVNRLKEQLQIGR